MRASPRWIAVIAVAAALGACDREERRFGDLGPGGARHAGRSLTAAWSIGEGQRVYQWFNCAGCHGLAGGGGMGPPLRDAVWLYGGAPEDVFRSIHRGRPNGMPSFANDMSPAQIWQVTAFVLSLSGRLRLDLLPGRPDNLSLGPPPSMTEEAEPVARQKGAR